MNETDLPQQKIPLFQRSDGTTPSERYLKTLCDKSFLSLWSYPNLFRDQGKTAQQTIGKEVCDLLVVFGNHILIFSDKYCAFPTSGNLDLDWSRWYRRAIDNSAHQIWGAERWIKKHPDRVFLDPECNHPFPLHFPNFSEAIFHRIIIAHGAGSRCRAQFGGSGSLMLDSTLIGKVHYTTDQEGYQPFAVGQVDPQQGYVHVFDDTTLDIVITTLDTVSDFIEYLAKKERFLTTKRVFAAGEEELLAHYLQNLNKNKEHDFITKRKFDGFGIEEGFWASFVRSPERASQIQANQSSYAWDSLIETFSQHLVSSSRYEPEHTEQADFHDTEKILRLMAAESRTRRRMLATALLGLVHKTPSNQRATRVLLPSRPGEPHYIFLLLPHFENVDDDEYRLVRARMLHACCLITKLRFAAATDIVGIATESGMGGRRSEDAAYLDGRNWNEDLRTEALELQRELEILTDPRPFFDTVLEYPSEMSKRNSKMIHRSKFSMKGRERNAPCICGSGLKFKNCCGRKIT